MNKVIMLVIGLLFTSRLFASIVPHVGQLEHDAPILLRSAVIVGAISYGVWLAIGHFKKRKTEHKQN